MFSSLAKVCDTIVLDIVGKCVMMKGMNHSVRVMLLAVAACGAPPSPPPAISISPDFSEDQRVVIEDAVNTWCVASEGDWCPVIATWSSRGHIDATDYIPMKAEEKKKCPPGEDCFVSGWNDGDDILIDTETWEFGITYFWRSVAHELGHFCMQHTKHGLMSPLYGYGEASYEDMTIDKPSLAAWREGCGF